MTGRRCLRIVNVFVVAICLMRISTFTNAQAAFNYYLDNLANYYESGAAFAGKWQGKGADELGLAGNVDAEHFRRLLNNRHPELGSKLSPRDVANRRIGYDINFNIPKSVSIVFGLNNDLEIVDALRESVNETLAELEQDVHTRINTGRRHLEKTGNMIAGVWIHPEARAVDGQMPDMQLHAHAFVSNHTFTGDRWTAADLSHVFKDAQSYYDAAFLSRLAGKLQDIGYPLQRSERDFEIKGISPSLRDKFSKRSAQIKHEIDHGKKVKKKINELIQTYGISLAEAKDRVGALTRHGKEKTHTLETLQENWESQLTPEEGRELDQLRQQKESPDPVAKLGTTAKQAVDFALDHRFEKEAAVRERDMLRDAILQGIGDNSVEDIRSELASRDLIRQGKDGAAILTTKELQAEEKAIVDFAKRGRGQVKPLYTHYEVKRDFYSDEQKYAITGLLESADRFQVLRGVAGVGKTTLLDEIAPAISETGKAFAMLAPTNKATQNLLNDGFKAATVQSFLLSDEDQKHIKDGVIIVDESGLVGNPTFAKLIRVAKEQNARILAVGDDRQHVPVERGHPLRLVERQAGIEAKTVSDIRRQSGKYKQAVASLSQGKVAGGFQQLKDLKFVHEIAGDDRNATLAKDYADALNDYQQKDLLVIAATHAERRHITNAIRSELKSRNVISSEEKDQREFTTLISKQLSKAQRHDSVNYQAGDVIAFHAKGKSGIEPGDQLTVASVRDGKVFAKGQREVPLESAGAFNVFRPEDSNYAVGDVIRLTRVRRQQGNQKKLANGGLHKITAFDQGVVKLDNGEKLSTNWRFFDHGIAVTSHVSQGTTVKRAFISASSLSFPASSPEQIYVSASRAKNRIDIYTDSIDGLEQAISRLRPKLLASDVQPESHTRRQPLGHKLSRVKQIAHQFATKQLKRFHDWLPSKSPEPQLGR